VLLTGGNGFVGSRVAKRLIALGHAIHAVVRRAGTEQDLASPLTTVIEGDFVDPVVTRRAAEGCQVVIHCAATAGPDLEPVRRVNVDGTRSVIDAALAAGCRRFIQVSTISVYAAGDAPVIDEGSDLKEQGEPYGVTKAEADRLVLHAVPRGLRATILRPGAILGAHPTSTWAVRVPERIRDRQVKLKIDGNDVLPYLHVENLVDAVLLALGSDVAVGRVYNVVDGHTTWRRYTDEVRSWFGTPPLEVIPEAEIVPGSYWRGEFVAQRIRAELGYSPRITYEEGMAEGAAYWRARR
jgi:nucleoside-diphosphate-sugar epimerase